MSLDATQRLHEALARLGALQACKLYTYFPDTGPLRRELYPRHIEHFDAGSTHRQRLMMAANRVGKTENGAFEVAAHCTGEYPAWWKGHRFEGSIDVWVAGKDSGTYNYYAGPIKITNTDGKCISLYAEVINGGISYRRAMNKIHCG